MGGGYCFISPFFRLCRKVCRYVTTGWSSSSSRIILSKKQQQKKQTENKIEKKTSGFYQKQIKWVKSNIEKKLDESSEDILWNDQRREDMLWCNGKKHT